MAAGKYPVVHAEPVSFPHNHREISDAPPGTVVLCTLNARYIHASLGLRYLQANMGALINGTTLIEFTINQRLGDIAEQLIAADAKIIGFGVYIWNIKETTELIALLKKIRPEITIVVGGPEVSYEYDHTKIYALCDHLITGQADLVFAQLCQRILQRDMTAPKCIKATTPPVHELVSPYQYYSSEDISHRVIYVEASRGCPFKCEFCLSALDKTAWPFDLEKFLREINELYKRGARQFKFVDRTFNLKAATCSTILQFFLDKMAQGDELFLHFEVIPDRLPDALKALIKQFPPGSLQFEIGIQSFDEGVQKRINRKQNIEHTVANLTWLHNHTNAHIHADLIFGLPGETLESFAAGFDQLVSLQPNEIQLGILKRLRGSPIVSKTDEYQMIYSEQAPYELLQNRDISFETLQRIKRFARYWDLIANSGRFRNTLPKLLGDQPFEQFLRFTDWLYHNTGQTHKISYARLLALVHEGACSLKLADADVLYATLFSDSQANGDPHPPRWLDRKLAAPVKNGSSPAMADQNGHLPADAQKKNNRPTPSRQQRHLIQPVSSKAGSSKGKIE